MKRYAMALVLVCAVNVMAQQPIANPQTSAAAKEPQSKPSELNIQYNKIEDRTNVSTKQQSVKGANFFVLFYFNHKGEKLQESINHVGLVVDSSSRDWKFLKNTDLRLFVLVDGERFNVDGSRYDSNVHSGYRSVTVSERLVFSFTIEQIKTLVAASSIEMQLGRDQFTFSDKIVKAIRQLVSFIETSN